MSASQDPSSLTPPPDQSQESAGKNFLQRLNPAVFAIATLFVVFFLYQIVGGLITWLLFKASLNEENVNFVRTATIAGQVILILVPTLILVRLRYKERPQFLRFKIPGWKLLGLTVVGVVALQQLGQGYMMLQDMIPLPQEIEQLVHQFKEMFEQMYKVLVSARTPSEFLFVVLVIAVTPAICEEILFRGMVQGLLEEEVSGLKAAILAGFIFAVYHLNPFSLIPLIALGAFFGFLYYRTRNILIPIFAHFVNNLIACLVVYLELHDDFVLLSPASSPGLDALLLNYTFAAVVFVGATYYFVLQTRPSQAGQVNQI